MHSPNSCAFPCPTDCAFPCPTDNVQGGLSIREYAAIHMASCMRYTPGSDKGVIAEEAVALADALINRLRQTQSAAVNCAGER